MNSHRFPSQSSHDPMEESLIEREHMAFYGVKKELRHFLVLGGNKVGKTSLSTRFLLDFFPESSEIQRLEEDICKIIMRRKIEIKLIDAEGLTDLQTSFENLSHYDADACFYVYSIDDRESFSLVKKLRQTMFEIYGRHIPSILLANKADLKEKKAVLSEEGWKLASDMDNIPFFEISCKNDNSSRIEEIFKNLYGLLYMEENPTEIRCLNVQISSGRHRNLALIFLKILMIAIWVLHLLFMGFAGDFLYDDWRSDQMALGMMSLIVSSFVLFFASFFALLIFVRFENRLNVNCLTIFSFIDFGFEFSVFIASCFEKVLMSNTMQILLFVESLLQLATFLMCLHLMRYHSLQYSKLKKRTTSTIIN